MLELFVSFYLTIQLFYCNNITKKAPVGSFTVCGKRHGCAIERKNRPAQVMVQNLAQCKPYLYQNGVGFKAGPSHLHDSVLLHLLRDSSHEGEAQGATGISLFSNRRKTGEARGSQRGSVPLTGIRPWQAQTGPTECPITGTLRNVRPQERRLDQCLFFSLGSQLAVALGKEKNIQTVKSRGKLEKLEPIFHLELK